MSVLARVRIPSGAFPVLAVALGTAVLLVVLRAWAVSVLFVYADAGSTPAVQMGLFALVPFGLALAASPWIAVAGPRRAGLLALALFAIGRLLLQFTEGGGGQLAASTFAFTVGLVWLAAVAAGAVDRRDATFGLVWGLALDAFAHTVLRTVDLPWRDGALVVLVVIAVLAVLLWAAVQSPPGPAAGAGWPWLAVGPILAVSTMVGLVARVEEVADIRRWGAAAVVLGAHAAAIALAVAARREPTRMTGVAAAILTLAGLGLTVAAEMPFESGVWITGGQVGLTIGLALALVAIGWAGGRSTPLRRALAAGGGGLLLFLIVFGYYTGYDVALPVAEETFLLFGAVVVAAVALAARPGPSAPALHVSRPVALAAAFALVVGIASVAVGGPPRPVPPGDFPITLVTYNVRMGVSGIGDVDLAAQAAVLRELDPDVVVLNEVARGWLVAGAADVTRLAELVGLPYVFGPAADDVWGNAVLSRYPVADVRVDPLPRGAGAMRRSALSLAVQLTGGQELGVVATHLHHVAEDVETRTTQLERVRDIAGGFTASGIPVVVVGDLNAEPGSGELRAIRRDLRLVTSATPPTYPSTQPVERIDHILISPQLTATGTRVVSTTASDHLPVVTTLRREG